MPVHLQRGGLYFSLIKFCSGFAPSLDSFISIPVHCRMFNFVYVKGILKISALAKACPLDPSGM